MFGISRRTVVLVSTFDLWKTEERTSRVVWPPPGLTITLRNAQNSYPSKSNYAVLHMMHKLLVEHTGRKVKKAKNTRAHALELSAIVRRSLSPWSEMVMTLQLSIKFKRYESERDSHPTRNSFPAAVPKATFVPAKW